MSLVFYPCEGNCLAPFDTLEAEAGPYEVEWPALMGFFGRHGFLQFISSYAALEEHLINTRNRFLIMLPYICSGVLWEVIAILH